MFRYLRGKDFFLAHGMADRNVHFQHGMVLAKELVRNNVQFKQQVNRRRVKTNKQTGVDYQPLYVPQYLHQNRQKTHFYTVLLHDFGTCISK